MFELRAYNIYTIEYELLKEISFIFCYGKKKTNFENGCQTIFLFNYNLLRY